MSEFADIRSVFSYDPISGVVRWKISPRPYTPQGTVVRSLRRDGYIRVKYRGKEFAAHRIAFFVMTGHWPDGFIDHINGVRSDNRWCNLRIASPAQNSANRRGARDGLKGVTYHRQTGKYQAQCKLAGVNYYLGLFAREQDAHSAYVSKSRELFGEFARSA